MAAKSNGWYMNSLHLKFLFLPFKAIYTIFLIVLIIFGISLFSQNYFKNESLIQQEIQQLNTLGIGTIGENSKSSINLTVSEISYNALNTMFFEWTQVKTALAAQTEEDFGYKFKNYLLPRFDLIQHFDDTLKVISIRIGNISLFIGLTMLLYFLAFIDGLVMRKIRQENASRESAGIYHRAKYWRVGITWLSILIYLCFPFTISPYWLMIPICASAYMVYLQMKYLKKYL